MGDDKPNAGGSETIVPFGIWLKTAPESEDLRQALAALEGLSRSIQALLVPVLRAEAKRRHRARQAYRRAGVSWSRSSNVVLLDVHRRDR